jgi:hypothetical protein
VKTLAVAVATASSLLMSAPSAHADDISFLTDAKAAGFGSSDGNARLIEIGHQYCSELSNGVTPEQIAEHLFEVSHFKSLDQARRFVSIAQQDLCP